MERCALCLHPWLHILQSINARVFPYVSDGDSLPSAAEMELTMVAVANGANAHSTSTQPWDKTTATVAPAKPSVSSDKPASAPTAPAAFVSLSDRAKAIIEKAKADQAATEGLTDTFDEMLTKRTDALAERLSKAFERSTNSAT
jgi:hypothetical protein